jgi:thiosulfate dehydrogenase [quinone] large subunit
MTAQTEARRRQTVEHFTDPPVAQALFGHVRWAWIWLILRVYAGALWVQAGWEKLHDPAWTGAKAGTALNGFVTHALTETGGAHPNVQGWYAWFLQHVVSPHTAVWGYVVSWGEFLVGVALILGIFTGIAAFFGAFMNMNYLLAGSVSTNPILLVIAVLLVLAWKIAGWWGLDRWILPALGTPWRPGAIFHHDEREGIGPTAENAGRA